MGRLCDDTWDEDEISKRMEHIGIKELRDLAKAMLAKELWLGLSIDEVEKELLEIWRERFGSG